jgi:[ribosomal protein S5]-alanine N-acetyltransferase
MDILYTQRLILRPLAGSDSDALFGARGDAGVMEFWDGPPDATCSETAAAVGLFLADVHSGAARCWTIRLRRDKSFIGMCDLSEIRNRESAGVGFMLLRKFWGSGFGQEVVRCLLTHARSLGLRLVTARIHSGNTRSQLLLARNGFRLAEAIPGYEIRPGVFRDCLRFEATP